VKKGDRNLLSEDLHTGPSNGKRLIPWTGGECLPIIPKMCLEDLVLGKKNPSRKTTGRFIEQKEAPSRNVAKRGGASRPAREKRRRAFSRQEKEGHAGTPSGSEEGGDEVTVGRENPSTRSGGEGSRRF